ncbi:hypothetical protein [Blastococcus montanus]|uniref:hypothetical protein n=1 Tax=Blastococcus montanus TaxID=3144973 RepID=UPI0032093A20
MSRPTAFQPTTPATRTAAAIPTQRSCLPPRPSRPPEQDWITLVATVRLLNRLQVERARHHFLDDAEAFARDADCAEEDLEHHWPARWATLKRRIAGEVARWWTEEHGSDPLGCTACRIQNRSAEQPITVPPPGQPWLT